MKRTTVKGKYEMLTSEDKKWFMETMDRRFAEQDKRFDEIDKRLVEHDERLDEMDKHLDEQDQHMGKYYLHMGEELKKQTEELMRHVDFAIEQQMEQLKQIFEVLPGANRSYDVLKKQVDQHGSNFAFLRQAHAAISSTLVSDVNSEYE